MQNIEGVLAWVGERLAVSMRQAEDLILRDFIISAASLVNAAGYNNGDSPGGLGVSDFSFANAILDTNNAEPQGVTKPLIIDMDTRWGNMAQAIERRAA